MSTLCSIVQNKFIVCLTLENIEHNKRLHVFYFCNIARKQIFSFLCVALKEFHRVSLLLNCIEHIFLCLYSSMLKNKYHPILSMRHSAQQISVCLRPAIRACINFFIMFLPLQHCARLISSCVSRPNKNRNKALQEYGQQQENVKKRTRKCSSRMLIRM